MTLSDEQIQDLLRVGNPTDEECRLLRLGWDAAMRERDATNVPNDILRDAVRYRFLRAAKNIPISSKAARDPVVYDEAIDAAMLAAAPEAHRDDQHAGGLNVLNYQGLMERARKNAKKEAGLIYPDDDARREEKERELASEYYRQYTQRNTGVEP